MAAMNSDISESTLNQWQEIAQAQPDGPTAGMLRELRAAEAEAAKRYGGGNGQHRPRSKIVGGNGQPPDLLSWRDL
jgi:hypothetical protein